MNNYNSRCGNSKGTPICTSSSLAVAYVNWQPPQSPMYNLEQAFVNGTIYKDLDKPFLGRGGVCK